MHHAEIVFLELRPEITGKLDAVKINLFQPVQILPADLSRFGIVVNAARGVNLAGKCPITGGRFQHGTGEAAEAVDFGFQAVDHLPCQIVRRGVEVQGIVWRCHGGKPLFVFRDSPGGAMGRGRFAVRPC